LSLTTTPWRIRFGMIFDLSFKQAVTPQSQNFIFRP
jgi:hypothetical protein